MKKILLIGCGHMGNSLLDSWIVTNKYRLTVIDPNKYTLLKKKYKSKKIKILKSINLLNKVSDYDFIVLAIRPSELRFVLDDLSQFKFKNNFLLLVLLLEKNKII